MTTKAAAAYYEAQHVLANEHRKPVIYNPHGKPVEELPIIFGFNNGGTTGWLEAVALAQDGTCLGGHICSSEAYMPHDLGILEGTRADRHETYRMHYADGYRMEFVGSDSLKAHAGLNAAIALANEKLRASQAELPASDMTAPAAP